MNQELMNMAEQAHQKLVSEVDVGHTGQPDPWTMELLKIFAALVAAAEREACIYEIEMHTPRLGHTSDGEIRSKKMIEAIRARGK